MSSDKKNIIWLASYPKSGNTWVRIFLQHILGNVDDSGGIVSLSDIPIASNRVLLETNLGVNSSDLCQTEMNNFRPLIYKSISEKSKDIQVLKVHDLYGKTSDGNLLFPKEVSKYAVYIVRNPLDVVVSYSKHSGKTIQTIVNQLNDPSFEISKNEKSLKPQVSQHLGTWSEHVHSWIEQKEIPVIIIKYEELLVDAADVLGGLLNRLEISCSKEDFENALNAVEFDKLKDLEQTHGFREKPMQAASFFRSGKKNVFKDYLNNDQIKEVKKCHIEIMTKLGYINDEG